MTGQAKLFLAMPPADPSFNHMDTAIITEYKFYTGVL